MLTATKIDLYVFKAVQRMRNFRLNTISYDMNSFSGKQQVDMYPLVRYNLYRVYNLRILDNPVFIRQYHIETRIQQIRNKIKTRRVIGYHTNNISISI